MNRILAIAATLAAGVVFVPSVSQANIGEAFGFGSRSSSLAGATLAWGSEAFTAYTNPAALTSTGGKKLLLSVSLMDMETRLLSIDNVLIENDYTSDKNRYGSVQTDYRSTFGTTVGLVYQPFPHFYSLSYGLTAFLPANQIAYLDTGETFIPEYVLYRSRTQRPQFEFAVGMEPTTGFSIGAGMHLAYSLTTNASILMQTNTEKPSTIRFAASLTPKLAPFFGLLYSSSKGSTIDTGQQPAWSAGAVLRLPVRSANEMSVTAGARVLGETLPILDFNFNSASAVFYDPMTIELGTSVQYTSWARVFLQADYQFWHQFEAPAIAIQKPTVEEGGINISGGKNPSFPYRNILIPRFGHEFSFSDSVFYRIGYAYRPSFMGDVPNGAGNYLDPPKHMLSMGVGFRYRTLLGFDTPCEVNFHASYQRLITQQITKTPGDERGEADKLKIGAPGYLAGGKLFGGGASLSMAL